MLGHVPPFLSSNAQDFIEVGGSCGTYPTYKAIPEL